MKKLLLLLTFAAASQAQNEEGLGFLVPENMPGSDIYLFDIIDKHKIPSLSEGKNITDSYGYDSQPKFSKDGQTIYYTTAKFRQTDIYAYDITKDQNNVYIHLSNSSEYSPTTIPGEKGLSVIQVDAAGDQYLVKLKRGTKAQRFSDLKQVGYHNWTKNKGRKHLWTFILNNESGGDLYHQGKDKKASKIASNIGRSFITDKNHRTLYYVDKNTTPWQIKSRQKKKGKSQVIMDLPLGSEDFTLDSKGRFWAGQGQTLFVSLDAKHWTMVKQFTDQAKGAISRVTTNPKADKIAIVFAEK